MTSTLKSSICMLLKCSTCIRIIVLKIMNCTTQFFMISSIWSRIIEICSHRLSKILSTRFATFKNIEFLIQIVRELELKLMYRFIKESFRQNWTSNQIAYVKKNYRKLSSIIRNRKNELKEIAFQRERLRVASVEFASIEFSATSVFAFASTSIFTFISASISTFVFASISTSVSASIFTSVSVASSSLAESSNVQSTQQSNVQRISKYFSTIYENRQYAQESTNSQRINQHWSISQRYFICYDDHQSLWYSK
jgi:hypothetical protein